MKSKAFGAAGGLIAVTLLLAPACGGSDPQPSTPSPDGGGVDATTPVDTGVAADGATAPKPECTTNVDCAAKLPPTTPADCAVATCDTLEKKCRFKAKDADGDGHAAKSCSAAAATIETGDDCDDANGSTYPGAWDGPATDFDSGPGVQTDRCDQADNDCNGSPDDGKLKVDGGDKTCKCDPNKPLPCYDYVNGTPIDPGTLDANNSPKGACKKGTRTCINGIPGACNGAVGPTTEQCDTLDRDCNGVSGTGGDTVITAPLWYKDTDNDNYGDSATPPRQQCASPAGLWKQVIPNSDCDDGDNLRSPALAEVCDGKDNNCNTQVDENVKTNFCMDGDGDGYCTTTCTLACTAPALHRRQDTCSVGVDCNDGSGAVRPGASELCGDGVDSNCTGGDSETYPNLGQACTAGLYGICKRTGTHVCTAARTATECNATAGAVANGSSAPSTDPLIDNSQARTNYNPKWDYNCNNVQELAETLTYGSLRTSACNGNYAAACASLTSQSECNQGVLGTKFFNCDYDPPGSFTFISAGSPKYCGRQAHYISCLWEFNGGSGCVYLANTYTPNNHLISCH